MTAWRDAELAAEAYMRWLGYDDATCTPPGTDSGIDVVHPRAVAQVKWRTAPTGRAEIQNLNGAASSHKQKLFFSRGYSRPAVEFATDRRIALFVLSTTGTPSPINGIAVALADAAPGGAMTCEDFAREAAAAKARHDQRTAEDAAEAQARKEQAARRRLEQQERRRAQQQRQREQRERQQERHERQLRAATERASAPRREPLPPGFTRLRAEDWGLTEPQPAVVRAPAPTPAAPSSSWSVARPTTRPASWWGTALWLFAWFAVGVVVAGSWLLWQALVLLVRTAGRVRAARRDRRAGTTAAARTAGQSSADQQPATASDGSPATPRAAGPTVVDDDRRGEPFVIDPLSRAGGGR